MEQITHCPKHDASMRLTRVLIASAICFGIAYLTWRTTTLGSGQFLLVSVPTLLVELWAFAAFFSLSAASWRRSDSRLANRLEDTDFPLVDVVVEAQSHDLEDLERTLVGLQALRGVGRIHILSDRHDVYALASTIGLHDVVRAAGDPLDCVRSADSRLVLWLEAGQITMPHLLAETVTRFDEPDVAVCQVAKGLVNADSLVHLQGGRNHDALWQQAIGPSLGASGDGPWTGPGSIVRPAALQDLGSGRAPVSKGENGPSTERMDDPVRAGRDGP